MVQKWNLTCTTLCYPQNDMNTQCGHQQEQRTWLHTHGHIQKSTIN